MFRLAITIIGCVLARPLQSDSLSFLILGDWGEPTQIPLEKQVSQAMNNIADQYGSQFVVSVGDNFYNSGVTSITDPKWDKLWLEVYQDTIGQLPWYAVMGNHDWYGPDPNVQVEYSKTHERWNMPSFFFDKVFSFGSYSAAFVFIDTNLLNYGYAGESNTPQFASNFESFGWTSQNNSVEIQLSWIENRLQAHFDKDYLFVVGHHYLGSHLLILETCDNPSSAMKDLNKLLTKYKATSYLFGHKHSLGFTRQNQVMYVLSGAGGHAEDVCKDNAGWAQGNIFGFVHAQVDKKKVVFDFIDSEGKVLHSKNGSPRKVKTNRKA